MNVLLYDSELIHNSFYPLSETRSVASLRCGILTLSQKWEIALNANVSIKTRIHLQPFYNKQIESADLFIKSNILPSESLIKEIQLLASDESLWFEGDLIVSMQEGYSVRKDIDNVAIVNKPWDLLAINGSEIENDIKRLGLKPSIGNIQHTDVYSAENVFIDESADVKSSVINAEKGSVYIGPNVTVSENCVLKGPLAILDGAELTMGAKLRNANTIGPKSVVGGELKNVIIQGYSNKGHEGYLGDSIVGEWVNLGANTNGSNLKNNYSNIKMWSKVTQKFEYSGKWKLGAVIGDYVHTGISTMLNSGTTIGVGANVFGTGYQEKYIPNFSWGMGGEKYEIKKFIEMATKLQSLKGKEITKIEVKTLKSLVK